MKSILQIHKPENSSHIIWEHLIKSALAFSGTFALLFFGPLLLSAKSRRRPYRDEDTSLELDIISYLLEHPEVQIGLCILAVIIYNVYIISKNSKRKYAVSISQDGDNLSIGISNLYYKTVTEHRLPIKDLAYEIKTKTSDAGEKQSTLRFIDRSKNREIAIIKPSHILWSKQIRDIRDSLKKLDSLNVIREEHNSTYTSVLGSLFKR